MKSILKMMAALCIAAICAGCAYMEFVPEKNVETRWFVETVRQGDTFNGIVGETSTGSDPMAKFR